MVGAREKIYTEQVPVDERTAVGSIETYTPEGAEKDARFALENLKHFIFAQGYPRRPLPNTFSLHIGKADGKCEWLYELKFSDAMRTEGSLDEFNRMLWFDSVTETLGIAEEMLRGIGEISMIIEDGGIGG